jgi:8-oxo-dGTP pyrophosphatase MutT (NUDIX family)
MHEVKACGVLVFRSTPVESFLLMRHPRRLDLPKGHLDAGETERQCALRELEEETGIRAADLELDDGFRFTLGYEVDGRRYGLGERVPKTLVIFLGRLIHEVPIQCTEHDGFVWVPWNPPHRIQAQTIDPLLAAVEAYRGLATRG